MIEQFEKLQDVKDILDDYTNIYFNQECDMYAAKKVISDESVSYPSWEVTYLNGAWYAFQEQQKQLDLINQYTAAQGASIKMLNDERIKQQKNKDAIKQKLHDIYNVCDEDETVAMLLDEIQELIK